MQNVQQLGQSYLTSLLANSLQQSAAPQQQAANTGFSLNNLLNGGGGLPIWLLVY